MRNHVDFGDLQGKTITAIQKRVGEPPEDFIRFETDDGIYEMYHQQDCCEDVNIEDISGDIDHLVGQEIIEARVASNSGYTSYGSSTWTFYVIRTIKDTIVIRWLGESNGYYSEEVSFFKVDDE